MTEDEKKQRLAEIRLAHERFAREAANQAPPPDPALPRLGSFAEDAWEIHREFAQKPTES